MFSRLASFAHSKQGKLVLVVLGGVILGLAIRYFKGGSLASVLPGASSTTSSGIPGLLTPTTPTSTSSSSSAPPSTAGIIGDVLGSLGVPATTSGAVDTPVPIMPGPPTSSVPTPSVAAPAGHPGSARAAGSSSRAGNPRVTHGLSVAAPIINTIDHLLSQAPIIGPFVPAATAAGVYSAAFVGNDPTQSLVGVDVATQALSDAPIIGPFVAPVVGFATSAASSFFGGGGNPIGATPKAAPLAYHPTTPQPAASSFATAASQLAHRGRSAPTPAPVQTLAYRPPAPVPVRQPTNVTNARRLRAVRGG